MSIQEYNYTPKLQFKSNLHDVYDFEDIAVDPALSVLPFIGIEMEFEHIHECQCELDKYERWLSDNDDLYVKRDSTLINGFEVVTHPATPDYWLLKHDWSWLERMGSWGFSHAETGVSGEGGAMHFHINRKAFKSDEHILEFENTLLGIDWIVEEGLAVDDFYAKRIPQELGSFEINRFNKYYWVRPTEHTVEVRCFRGSTDRMDVLMAMQIILAVINVSEREVC